MRIQELRSKKIAVWGLGAEGWSTLKTLRKKFPAITITVINDAPLSKEMEMMLTQDPFLKLLTGENVSTSLIDFDVIIKSPGISAYRPEIKLAAAAGVQFTSATRLWFAEHPDDKTVCITGTKGKSTTSSLVTHLLRNAGIRVTLGGNIGTPMLDMLDVEPKPDVWVMELSSYQVSDLDTSPSIGVLLNLFPEHLDWHGNVENYYKDKLNLFSHQSENGISIINKLDKNTALVSHNFINPVYFNDDNGMHIADGYICDGKNLLFPAERVTIPGNHNLSNMCAALTVVKALGIEPESCVEALSTFRGLPHRLFPWGTINDVLYIDDSISTTPQSAVAALETYPGRPVTILLGGFDRGLNVDELARYVATKPVYAVITMPDNGPRIAETIRKALDDTAESKLLLQEAEDLKGAVSIAKKITPAGGVILLSPGAPSYGRFKNFSERGNTFARIAGFDVK